MQEQKFAEMVMVTRLRRPQHPYKVKPFKKDLWPCHVALEMWDTKFVQNDDPRLTYFTIHDSYCPASQM